jgi:hypothetical protein
MTDADRTYVAFTFFGAKPKEEISLRPDELNYVTTLVSGVWCPCIQPRTKYSTPFFLSERIERQFTL